MKRLWRVLSLVVAVTASLLVQSATPAVAASPGDLDVSFGDEGVSALDLGVDAGARMRLVQLSDGRFVVLGSAGDSYAPYLAWFDPSGAVLRVVAVEVPDTALLADLAVDGQDRIIVVGRTDLSSSADFIIARFTDAGVDDSFGTGGIVTVDFGGEDSASAVALDGASIVVSGGVSRDAEAHTGVARLLETGALDPSFSSDGRATVSGFPGWAAAIDGAHRVHVGVRGFSVARFTVNGDLDGTYGDAGIASIPEFGDFVRDIALQPDGKAIITGQECCDLGTQAFAVARFDLAGRPDTSFNGDGKVQFAAPNRIGQGTALAVAVQHDGKIIAVGGQDNAGPSYDGSLVVRLTSDGRFDQSFGVDGRVLTQFDYEMAFATDVVLQPDGRIVTGGFFGDPYSPMYLYLFLARYAAVGDTPPTPPTTSPPTGPPPGGSAPTDPSPPAGSPAEPPRQGPQSGYWMLDDGGSVYAFGDAPWLGNASLGRHLAVDIEPTVSGAGYWVVDSAGHVVDRGDARWHGNAGTLERGETVTSLSRTKSGGGYWLFTTRGRVIPRGDARFLGDMAGVRLNGPVLDSIPTASGDGYYMVASDGGIFTFGDASFHGSMGAVRLNQPVQSLVPDPDGVGYWLVASDGGIFSFQAPFYGSMGGTTLNKPVTGMVGFREGYLMAAEDGGIFSFGGAPFKGSLGANPPSRPIVSASIFFTP